MLTPGTIFIAMLFLSGVQMAGAYETASASYKNTRSSVNNSGQRQTSSSYSLYDSVGEIALATRTSASYLARSGLQSIYQYPGMIMDLDISTDSCACRLSLSWTAPGNDAYAPGTQASAYIIKQSTTASQSPAISDALFNAAATLAVTPPVPAVQGAKQGVTLEGLDATTYYLAIKALEADGLPGALSVGLTVNNSCQLLSVALNFTHPNAPQDNISLSWNSSNLSNATLIVRQAASAPSMTPVSGTAYNVGDLLGGATVVFANGGGSFVDTGLPLDNTWYYTLYAGDACHYYAAAVSTFAVLNLKPLFVAGLDRTLTDNASHMTLSWSRVDASENGRPFVDPASPKPSELYGYRVYRSTSLWSQSTLLASLPVSATAYTDAINASDYYYHLTAYDKYSQESEPSHKINALNGGQCVAAVEKKYELSVDHSLADFLNKNNPTGRNIHVSAVEHPEQVGGKILAAYEFVPHTDAGETIDPTDLRLPDAKARIAFYYENQNGQVAFAPQGAASAADSELGLYWYNGSQWVKTFGQVDKTDGSISNPTGWFGSYQVRALQRAKQFGFDASGVLNRFITPNGDNKNDTAVFRFNNPSDEQVKGRIFDLKGAFVAEMTVPAGLGCAAVNECLEWDAKAGGRVVASGIYVYQIEGQGKTYNGTVVVIR